MPHPIWSTIADNTTTVSQTVVDEQQNLDAFLISVIGLADIGNEVVGAQPSGADRHRCTCWSRPPTCSTNTTTPIRCGLSGLCRSRSRRRRLGRRRVSQFHSGCRAVSVPEHLPKVAATRRPAMQPQTCRLPAEFAPALRRHRRRRQPVEIRESGHPAELRRSQAGLFGPLDGPPATPRRSDKPG